MTLRTTFTEHGIVQRDGATTTSITVAPGEGVVGLVVAVDGVVDPLTPPTIISPDAAEHLGQRLAVAASLARRRAETAAST